MEFPRLERMWLERRVRELGEAEQSCRRAATACSKPGPYRDLMERQADRHKSACAIYANDLKAMVEAAKGGTE